MTYNAANELLTMQSENGKISYSYDANGNLTQKELDGKKDTYTYDALNRLTSYVGYDGYAQNYTYNAQSMMSTRETKGDPNRQTLEEIVSGKKEEPSSDDNPDPAEWVKTSYTYDVTAAYYEVLTETTSKVTTAYDYGVERLSSYSSSSAWNTIKTQYVYDGRSSVAQELSNNNSWYTFGGALAKTAKTSYSYTPFGELLSGANAKTTFFAYNGESYDSATGMLNLRARWYEPAMMRFSQRDILKGDQSVGISLNKYLYCENNPVNFVDPSGESLTELWEKAKTAANNAVSAVKKVAVAAYNAGKTVVNSAIQQVATVVKPVVNKVMNTVQEVATVAKTQGYAAAIKALTSNAASVPAYVRNVVKETVGERQAIQAKSAQQITSIAQDMGKDLARIAKNTYGILSPRNQEIIVNAMQEVKVLQANGASWFEIARVITGACTDIKKNVEETVRSEVENELYKAARNDKHIDASVEAIAVPRVDINGINILGSKVAKVSYDVYVGHNENKRDYDRLDANLAVAMSEQEGTVEFQVGESLAYKDLSVSGMLSMGGISYDFGYKDNSSGIGISVEGEYLVLSVSQTVFVGNDYTRTTTYYSLNKTVAGFAVAAVALGGEAIAIVSGGALILEKVLVN